MAKRQRYGNLGGDSPIRSFEIRPDAIVVEFKDSDTYLYNYKSPGRELVEEMKRLAESGRGLAGFISRNVRKRYAEQLK